MNMNTAKAVTLSILLVLALTAINSSNAYAQIIKVEEISDFTVEIKIMEKEVHTKNIITLRNLINKPLVPGIGEIRLQKKSPKKIFIFQIPFTEEVSEVKIKNLKAYTKNGRDITVRIENRGDYTAIVYEVWYPIEPKKELTIIVEYTSPDFVESGIFFKEILIPIGTDTDIKNVNVKLMTDLNIVYTYIPAKSIPAGGIIFYSAELSSLPLPNIGIKWANIIWSILLLISIIISILIIKTKKKKESEY